MRTTSSGLRSPPHFSSSGNRSSSVSYPLLLLLAVVVLFLICYNAADNTTGDKRTSSSDDAVSAADSFKAIGSSDFYKLLVEDGTFVDKSLMIEEYLRRWRNKILVSRPRQWGKSVNLDMLRRYLEIELDRNGEPLLEDKRVYRKLFLGGQINRSNDVDDDPIRLEPLKICKYEFIAKRQGEFPVIFLSLTNLTGSNYREFEDNVRQYVGQLFRRYRYVRESQTDEDKVIYDMFVGGGGTNVTIDLVIFNSLNCNFLSQFSSFPDNLAISILLLRLSNVIIQLSHFEVVTNKLIITTQKERFISIVKLLK